VVATLHAFLTAADRAQAVIAKHQERPMTDARGAQ
jgi:hypothetical protein